MTRIAMLLAGALVLGACGGAEEGWQCPSDATSREADAAGVTCHWQCTTKAGHPVVLAWQRYEFVQGQYVLVSEDGLAGVCVP